MQKPIVITVPSLRAYGYRRAIAGLMVGAVIAYGTAVELNRPAVAVVDTRMERACGTWPRYEAEALTIIVVDGKVRCWQMGYDHNQRLTPSK